ncbi:MAG TPA: hypothetical protein VH044_07880, partial [Polyangiaceae bacterium]|nr:hypothetical protein [Polyangiaceae bacterium]
FFEMATGRLPFTAPDPATFLIRHLKDVPPSPRSIEAGVPERLDALILQLLEKDPRVRPVDAHRVENDLVELARALRVPVPTEPEADPSSSRPPARTRPSAAVDGWSQRVELFEQMAARAYGPNPPGDQGRMLSDLKRLVGEINEARAASAKEQRAIEQTDARGRDGRQRLGFAVDALGIDASKARDEVRAARAELEAPAAATKRAAKAYVETQRELVSWEGRAAQVEPYKQLAEAHRKCAEAVDAWLVERKREKDAQSALEGKERNVADLEYQIAELRAALAKHEQGIDRDRDAAQKRAVEMTGRQEALEQHALRLATSFCAPLRTRSDLSPLFQRLELSLGSI